MKILAFTGMPGCGKSSAGELAQTLGIRSLRFGDLTDEEVKNRGLKLNEANEREVRESLRKERGDDAYAQRIAERIDALDDEVVVLDGLKHFAELTYLKEKYGSEFMPIAILSSPRTRYDRLADRKVRPLTKEEGISRDFGELENLKHGSTIAMSDHYLVNESEMTEFKKELTTLINRLAQQPL